MQTTLKYSKISKVAFLLFGLIPHLNRLMLNKITITVIWIILTINSANITLILSILIMSNDNEIGIATTNDKKYRTIDKPNEMVPTAMDS